MDLLLVRDKIWRIKKGYAVTSTGLGRCGFITMHTLIMDSKDKPEVDHINRNKLDNRRFNLRLAGKSLNNHNIPARTSIGLKGVYWKHKKRKFVSEIQAENGREYLGIHSSPIQAARAYDVVAFENYGDNGSLNFNKKYSGIKD